MKQHNYALHKGYGHYISWYTVIETPRLNSIMFIDV